MTVSLFQRVQVKNFDAWLNPDQDAVAQMMKDNGVLHFSLHRNLDDPNALMIHYQFADENTSKSFVAWMEAMIVEWPKIQPGSEQEILEWWVGEDVQGYSM
jgi:quinol monooxygenase YgiN